MISIMRRAPSIFNSATYRRRVQKTLDVLNHSNSELSILLTDDEEVHALNLQYRGKDKATDVLSFPQAASGFVLPGVEVELEPMLGDIVLSLDAVSRQAEAGCLSRIEAVLGQRANAWSALDEATFLTLHGVLHLLGYDHEESAEAERMETQESQAITEILKFTR